MKGWLYGPLKFTIDVSHPMSFTTTIHPGRTAKSKASLNTS